MKPLQLSCVLLSRYRLGCVHLYPSARTSEGRIEGGLQSLWSEKCNFALDYGQEVEQIMVQQPVALR